MSSSRWAHTVVAANDARHRASRDAQDRHIVGLRAAIAVIEKRLALPTADMLSDEERAARKKQRLPRGYPSQAERFQKQGRLQSLRAELSQVMADRGTGRVRVTEGGRRLAKARHNFDAAGLTVAGWRMAWDAARWRIEAIGSGDGPFGNLTITVTPQHIAAIAIEDLDFTDARITGRESMGRGRRGKRFRKTVSGIPAAVFRNRLTAQTRKSGIRLYAVNPAYTPGATSTGGNRMITSPGTRQPPP